jgi:hypothetical protein
MRWRRLDVVGTDRCTLERIDGGWRLAGLAEFVHAGRPARLRYLVECDPEWRTTRGEVSGFVSGEDLSLAITRDGAGRWHIGGRAVPELDGLIDLDLGFTPATDLFPLRRLSLAAGEAASAEAAWLDDTDWRLKRLPQRYERRDATTYWYESPAAGYAGLLGVTAEGFVREYPDLWTALD